MMEVKGSAVVPIPRYIKEKYPDKYGQWLNVLPEDSLAIMKSGLTSNWYPLGPGMVTPTQAFIDILQETKKKIAWDMGRFSADNSLKGIYSVFIKVGSPGFIMNRGAKIFASYYRPCELVIASHDSNSITTHITHFPEPNELVEYRIAGWMERALELSGCKKVSANITRSMTSGDTLTEIVIRWE